VRYEIDWKRRIVDFYIEDDSGKEHHAGLTFDEFKDLFTDIQWGIDNPTEVE